MKENWADHLELLTKKLFTNLEIFNRDDPFSFYRETWSYFADYIRSFEGSKVNKSEEISWDYLKQGNLVCTTTLERILCYSHSIYYAPDNSPPLMIAYLKRSQLLLEMGYVRESETDSAMAFQCFIENIEDSPNENVLMNKEPEVVEKIMEGTLGKMKIPEEEISYVKREIVNLIKRHLECGSLDVVVQNDECSLPALKYGENANFPSSSNALRVEYSKSKGRHVVANYDIKVGDVLFVEKPFSFVAHKLRCSHCCQKRYTYIPCTHCRDVQYCSRVCRDEDWESCHKYECGFVDLLKETGIGYLALKMLLKAESNIDKLKNLSQILRARETCTNTVFSQLKYENVYNLLSHSESIATADFLHYSLTALLLSFYLIHCTHYAVDTEENVYFCATIILRHIIQLITNAHAITATEIDLDESCATIAEDQEQIGSAIYPSVSIMNHSCCPSVFITFRKSYIIVKAGKDIDEGEEVFNSYGADCGRMTRRDRQEILRAQYLFDCNCEACCEKYDRYDVLNSFKCGICKGPLVKEWGIDMSAKSGDRLCLYCSQYQTIPEEIMSLEFYISGLLRLGEQTLKENKVLEALKIYVKGWNLSREFFFPFHPHTSHLSKKIALCLFRLNRLRDCMKVLSSSIVCVEGRFGRYSSELAMEAKKLGEVISYYCRNVKKTGSVIAPDVLTAKERDYLQMCKITLKALYGEDHPLVRDDIEKQPISEYTGGRHERRPTSHRMFECVSPRQPPVEMKAEIFDGGILGRSSALDENRRTLFPSECESHLLGLRSIDKDSPPGGPTANFVQVGLRKSIRPAINDQQLCRQEKWRQFPENNWETVKMKRNRILDIEKILTPDN